jgi:hypothetical protein
MRSVYSVMPVHGELRLLVHPTVLFKERCHGADHMHWRPQLASGCNLISSFQKVGLLPSARSGHSNTLLHFLSFSLQRNSFSPRISRFYHQPVLVHEAVFVLRHCVFLFLCPEQMQILFEQCALLCICKSCFMKKTHSITRITYAVGLRTNSLVIDD